jgi:hypothetical protein
MPAGKIRNSLVFEALRKFSLLLVIIPKDLMSRFLRKNQVLPKPYFLQYLSVVGPR